MKHRILHCLAFAGALASAASCAVEGDSEPTDDVSTIGEDARVRFDVVLRAPPSEGTNAIVIVPTRIADGAPMPMAHVHVLPPEMPAMGHISTVRPEVSEDHPGEYTVGDVVITMPGTWRLRVEIDSPDVADAATIALDVHE